MKENSKNELKKAVLAGMFWSYGELILAQVISFVVSVILSRILSPKDYGVIAIVTIFLAISDVFIINGLGNSLIQKKDVDETDYSTVFFMGLVLSGVLYLAVYLVSPLVATFYNMPNLDDYIRVLALRIPIASINTVQHAYVSKNLLFKKFFLSTLGGTITSAVVGILMAYKGCGAWALVAQTMTNTIIDTCVLFVTIPWKPKLLFSFKRCKPLFKFGWKIVVSELIQTLYNNLRSLAVGKKYTSADLAYYNKGQQMTNLVVTNVDASLSKVLFPAIANQQEDISVVRGITRRAIRISSFVMCPLLIGLIVVSEKVVILLFTEKWLSVVPYLQILCVANLFQPMHSSNLQAIKAIGRSDISLKMEIIKKTYSIIILMISIVYFEDPFAVAIGFVLSTFISIIVNSFPNKKLLSYGYKEQIRDILPHIALAISMGVIVRCVGRLVLTNIVVLIIQIIVGAIYYVVMALVLKFETALYMLNLIKMFRK